MQKTTLGKNFGWFISSNLFAQSAEQIGLATAPLIAVFLLGATASETALLQTVQSLPFLVLAIPGGLLADRAARRTMLIAAEIFRAGCFGVIILCLFTGTLNLWSLAALGFLGASGTVAYNVTSPGMVPLLVEKQSFSTANSRLELARSIAFTAGPSVAGLVYSAWGGSLAYGIALVLTLSAVGLIAQVPLVLPAAKPRAIMSELREGFDFTLKNQHLRPVLFTAIAFNTSWFILQASFVPFAAEQLMLGPGQIGAVMAIYGVGTMVGAISTPWLASRLSFGMLVVIGPIGGFAGALIMSANLWSPSPLLAWTSFFCFGAGPAVWAAATATLRQAVTPQTLISRVSSVIMTFTFGARPLGALISALVAGTLGTSACIIAAVIGFSIQLLIIFMSNIWHLKTIPYAPST